MGDILFSVTNRPIDMNFKTTSDRIQDSSQTHAEVTSITNDRSPIARNNTEIGEFWAGSKGQVMTHSMHDSENYRMPCALLHSRLSELRHRREISLAPNLLSIGQPPLKLVLFFTF